VSGATEVENRAKRAASPSTSQEISPHINLLGPQDLKTKCDPCKWIRSNQCENARAPRFSQSVFHLRHSDELLLSQKTTRSKRIWFMTIFWIKNWN